MATRGYDNPEPADPGRDLTPAEDDELEVDEGSSAHLAPRGHQWLKLSFLNAWTCLNMFFLFAMMFYFLNIFIPFPWKSPSHLK